MIKNIWKALFESTHMQLKDLKKRIKALENVAHEPQNYKEKCDEMEERIEALEKKTKMFR